ncbi:hypothetical protein [Maridesulfovibrio hydrothermalis]|uniref:Uncharacterized protein n=1 Tax=Maridesulfovibrio hydrothermalis AM13 = DSM 14728 TaxID=1121451 RepID=L0RAH4_9BACT|nr:hypothetical protein [Maridesulfovibrio hydrothermalis]CCO23778.1 conserved protein of unknown function [Maridesulfovibrio hydrothermalis AM13 = DSM 14728]
MSNDLAVKNLAADYAEHFDFDFGDAGMVLTLQNDAPAELKQLIRELCGSVSPESLVKVYESLNAIAECDDIYQCEIDEKVCELTLFCKIARRVEQIAVS